MKNLNFQNIQKNFCENGYAKPLFMRVPRAEGRNEGRPYQGIDTVSKLILPLPTTLVEMQVAPFRAFPSIKKDQNFSKREFLVFF